MTGATYFFIHGKPVRKKRSGAMIVPMPQRAPVIATVRAHRTEPATARSERPAEPVAAIAEADHRTQAPPQSAAPAPEPPVRTAADPWETVLTALREDQEQRSQEWHRQQQEHQERMQQLQQQMKDEVEAAFRRVLES